MAILKVDTISGIGTEGPVFEGDIEFTSQNFLTLPKGDTTQRGRGRGVIGSGYIAPARSDIIDYITIHSEGNATDFGDLTVARSDCANVSSSTRGIFASGYSGGDLNVLDFVTIATKANAQDFGDLAVIGASQTGAASSPTRGVIMGGIGGSPRAATNTTQKIEILTEGNSVDFGDITTARNAGGGISNGHGGL